MGQIVALTTLVFTLGAGAARAQTLKPRLVHPNGLALAKDGSLYISDIGSHQILKLSSGKLTVVAGSGEGGYGGDNGPAAQAKLFTPQDLAIDSTGALYIADSLNHRVRRIDSRGVITTVAGTGESGYSGDGGPATAATLNGPQGLAFDHEGRLLIADTYNHVVRRVDRNGVITTFAGTEPGLSGDGGPATKARISLPADIAAAPDGTVYIAEIGNSRVRRVAPDGTLDTLTGYGIGSGQGGAGYGGDGGPAAKARLFSPGGLALDEAGNLYICDSGNNRVRVIRNGVITTIAGTGEIGFGGDGGPAGSAVFNTPQKIALAPDGRLYIADRGNGRVRMVDTAGKIVAVAGEGKPRGFTLGYLDKP